MKIYLTSILLLLWAVMLTPIVSVGQDFESNLSSAEIQILDSLLIDKKNEFSFENKKVAFISGHSSTHIETKEDFFETYIYGPLDRGLNPVILFRELDSTDKAESGGFDVIVMQVPKLRTNKQHQLNIKKLAEIEKGN